MKINDIVQKAGELRRQEKDEEAEAILRKAIEQWPDNGELHFQMAWCMDVQGREQEAVTWYEKAIALGLERESLEGAFLGLGSTLKNVGRIEDSIRVFLDAIATFPENPALRVFHSITLASAGQTLPAYKEVVRVLLDFPDNAEVQLYRGAIEEYIGEMR